MTELPREVTAAEIAQLLQRIDGAAERVGFARADVLDVEDISNATGIEPERVRELLSGSEPVQPPREKRARESYYRHLVMQRLDRLRAGQSYRKIGDAVGLSHAMIGNLVNGTRSAQVDYSSPLEELYGVDHGFLSKPEGLALAQHLAKVKEGLIAAALHDKMLTLGAERVALRHTDNQPPSLETLLDTLDSLVAQKRSSGADDAT
ncbi:helix-turn-helix domain-containing protein [Streptomyces olivaceus]|uniref:helix-turn-helix domain-containing protein n=1 Tax=Streptomyces olivaceus TaxID=47716 RepID=UPI0022EE383C|nr:helix-turn-helix transcriptional regulator [Streptomyces olivaceus]GHI97997.1 hypothetical protein TPA0905_74680 [Streptomyces olivaceus]